MRNIIFNRENGAALVIVMVLIVVIPIFLGAILQYSLSAQKSVMYKKQNTQAYYLARSGAEAALEAWKDYNLSEKPELLSGNNSAELERLYLTKNGQFTREGVDDYIGYVDVNVKRQEDQTTTFTAVADVAGRKQTVTATVSAYVDGSNDSLDWYDENNGLINPGPSENIETVEVDSWLNNLLGINEIDIKYHDPIAGVVECGDSSFTMSLREDNNKNKVAYIADTLFFNSPLDLRLYTTGFFNTHIGSLIVSGETIIFDKEIKIRRGLGSYGSLILYVTEGIGIKLKNREGIFGKVYFNSNVLKRVPGLFPDDETIISAGSYFYFKKMEKGVDLLEIEDSNNDGIFEDSEGNEVMIPIPSDDENNFVPDAEEELRVIWN